MGGRNAVAGAGRKPKVKATGDTDFDDVYDIDVPFTLSKWIRLSQCGSQSFQNYSKEKS